MINHNNFRNACIIAAAIDTVVGNTARHTIVRMSNAEICFRAPMTVKFVIHIDMTDDLDQYTDATSGLV